jgi:hypothetical protein
MMKTVSLSFTILGVLCIAMAALTALEVAPALLGQVMAVGDRASTVGFWGGLAGLLILAGIAFGVISGGRLEG